MKKVELVSKSGFFVVVCDRTNGDSFYEYLLKMYVLCGDVRYWDMFMQTYVSLQVSGRMKRADKTRVGSAPAARIKKVVVLVVPMLLLVVEMVVLVVVVVVVTLS